MIDYCNTVILLLLVVRHCVPSVAEHVTSPVVQMGHKSNQIFQQCDKGC